MSQKCTTVRIFTEFDTVDRRKGVEQELNVLCVHAFNNVHVVLVIRSVGTSWYVSLTSESSKLVIIQNIS